MELTELMVIDHREENFLSPWYSIQQSIVPLVLYTLFIYFPTAILRSHNMNHRCYSSIDHKIHRMRSSRHTTGDWEGVENQGSNFAEICSFTHSRLWNNSLISPPFPQYLYRMNTSWHCKRTVCSEI